MTGQVKQLSAVRRDRATAFGARLQGLMFERRISIRDLHEATGISVRLIGKYRAGETEPRDYFGDPTPNGRALAKALSVSLSVLLPVAERPPEDLAA